MVQYLPAWRACGPGTGSLLISLNRRITPDEGRFAIRCACNSGLHRGFKKKSEKFLDMPDNGF
jgi:hypothetical protein